MLEHLVKTQWNLTLHIVCGGQSYTSGTHRHHHHHLEVQRIFNENIQKRRREEYRLVSLVLHERASLFFLLDSGKVTSTNFFCDALLPLSSGPCFTLLLSELTFGLSRFIEMRGARIEYLVLRLWPLLVKHSPTPTCTVTMRHCPLARLSSWSMARALCAGTWRDDTKNRKNTSSQGFCTPRCHLCDRHNSDQCSALGWIFNILRQNLINIKYKAQRKFCGIENNEAVS